MADARAAFLRELQDRLGQRIDTSPGALDTYANDLSRMKPEGAPLAALCRTHRATDTAIALGERLIGEITELALSLGSMITGEQGVGAVKHHQLHLQQGPVELEVQRAIKQTLDPNGILSPGRAI